MKVLVLCHSDLVPPKGFHRFKTSRIDNRPWRTEGFVARTLIAQGHDVTFCGVSDKISPLRSKIASYQPNVIFNLLEEFDGEAVFEPMLVSYVNSLGLPITGGAPIELLLTKNKLATKSLLRERKIRTPAATGWPRIVKYVTEESSRGVSERAVVNTPHALRKAQKRLVQKLDSRVFAESFISGRELHCGVLFDRGQLRVSQLLETDFGRKPGRKILTERAKWDFSYRRRMGIELRLAALSPEKQDEVRRVVRKTAAAMGLRGPARIDLRLSDSGDIYVIEVNTNPDLAEGDEFAQSFAECGISYSKLISMVLKSAH